MQPDPSSLSPGDLKTGERMRQLWAPWRLAYVASAQPPSPGDPCFLCQGRDSHEDRRHLVVWRSELSLVVLNRFPYNNGHLLVAPLAHKGRLEELTPGELTDCQLTLVRMLRALEEVLHPEGYNLGLNLGRAAGAGLPGHLHWHLVPRWTGDTNFMPVLADTKVIAQSLEALYDLLQEHLCRKTVASGENAPQ
jgi:ATP adenylyltransferase